MTLARLRGLGARERHPLGAGRRASRAVQARRADGRHVAGRPGPPARGRDDDRGRASGCSRACCRWTTSRAARSTSPGRFAELIDRLGAAVDALRGPQSVAGLGGRAGRRRRRARPPRPDEPWQRVRAAAAAGRRRRRGRRARRRARAGRGPRAARRAPAGPPDARELPHRPPDDLHAGADALGAAPRRLPARARRRHVPAQGPARRRRPDARDPHVGERDARTEDRQLLLDALMAATRPADHHLHGQRRAHEPRRARRRCPSASCWTWSGASVVVRASAAAVRPAQLRAGALVRQAVELRPRDARGRAGAGGRAGARRAPFLPAPLPPRERGPLELTDLVRFVEQPVRAFLRQRLGISVGDYSRRGRATRCRSSWTRWRSGASASGCWTP